jgi:hypothetical protein
MDSVISSHISLFSSGETMWAQPEKTNKDKKYVINKFFISMHLPHKNDMGTIKKLGKGEPPIYFQIDTEGKG